MTNTIAADIQQLELPAVVELFELDLSPLGEVDIYRFHDGTNALGAYITWQGETYTAFPIAASGFDASTNGQLPRPKLQVSNVNGSITALLLAFNDLCGAKLTRHRTLSKYLDAVNFPGGVNPTADPDAAFASDVFFIDRKAAETNEVVEFELAAAFDVSGVQLPRRIVVQNLCPWRYRSSECSYSGPPIADNRDNLLTVSSATSPEEVTYFNARAAWLAARNARIAAQQTLAQKQNALAVASEVVKLETRYDRTYPNLSYVVGYRNGGTAAAPVYRVSQAMWNDAVVTLGTLYRMGAIQDQDAWYNTGYFNIERWGIDTAAQATAQGNYNAALATLTAAQGTETSTKATYTAAIAALPVDGYLNSADACGKRLASCRLRFVQPDQPGVLPFGGFPAVGLVS